MERFSELADRVSDIEREVSDAVYDALRSQLRNTDDVGAKELERHLAKVRRSLQKAEILLRATSERSTETH